MDETPGLLSAARSRAESGDFLGVVGLLEPVPRADLLGEPELGYHLAYAWRRLGRAREALELARALDVPVRRRASDWLLRRRTNLEAMLLYDIGDLRGAGATWELVVELAARADDRQLLAAAHNNLGVLHTIHDRMEEALATYQRALLACRSLGDTRGMAQASQNIAIVFRELGMSDDAESHFQEALRLSRLASSEDVRGRVEEERALLQLERGDPVLARASAARALRRFSAIRDAAGEGETRRVLGIIALRERKLGLAAEHLGHALRLAGEIPNPLLEAETHEALALLAELDGRAADAAQHRDAGRARFQAMGAEPWGSRIRKRTSQFAGCAARA